MLRRAVKFAKRGRSIIGYVEFNRVTPFDGTME